MFTHCNSRLMKHRDNIIKKSEQRINLANKEIDQLRMQLEEKSQRIAELQTELQIGRAHV